MMKVTDDALMHAIFCQTIKYLPYRAIQRYVGERVSMASEDHFPRAIRQLAANRKHLQCGLGESQSLTRLRALVDMQHLRSDEIHSRAEPGRTFWYWLPENIMRPVWERTREIMTHCGMPEAHSPRLMPKSDSLVESISYQLAEEFALVSRETGAGLCWRLKSNR
jgi:hypothetical protein